MQTRILVLDDEKEIADLVTLYLKNEGYQVHEFYDSEDALRFIKDNPVDLAMLDIMMPKINGFEICKIIREKYTFPVIMLTAKIEDMDKIQGLSLGADDYITKPFGTFELLARIRTAIRHNNKLSDDSQNANRPYAADGLTIDFERRLVTLHGKEIHLTRVEYKIVSLLAKNSGKVMTYDTLIDQVWGPYADDNNRILRVNMANIRRKIEENPGEPKYIFTELGVGYRMLEDGN